jgi:hypothetical protein
MEEQQAYNPNEEITQNEEITDQTEDHITQSFPSPLNEVSRLKAQNSELNKHLKDALMINQVLASCVEIMGETHLTKAEKYNIITNLNEASNTEEVDIRTEALKKVLGISEISEDFRKEQKEDDSFWSTGFRNELDDYYNTYSGVNIKNTLSGSVIDINNYFDLLTQYSSNQSNPEKVNLLTQSILEQEPKAREGLKQLKSLLFTMEQLKSDQL